MILFAVVGGVIIMAVTVFLITCLHLIKMFFKIFIQREKINPNFKHSAVYRYTEPVQRNTPETGKKLIKTIDVEAISKEN